MNAPYHSFDHVYDARTGTGTVVNRNRLRDYLYGIRPNDHETVNRLVASRYGLPAKWKALQSDLDLQIHFAY